LCAAYNYWGSYNFKGLSVLKSFLTLALVTLPLLSGCGQKSTIKNYVEAKRLADAYGDGKYVIRNPVFPLSDSALAYSTPLPGFAPIAGGILKFVGDIFAANTNMGKLAFSYTQPLAEYVSEIPQELHSVRLKRFILYMKPVGKERFRDILARWLLGKGDVTFDFLDKFAINIETENVKDPENYTPILIEKKYSEKEFAYLTDIFEKWYRPDSVVDPEQATKAIILRYHSKTKDKDTNPKSFGNIHYLEVNPKSPAEKEMKQKATEAAQEFLSEHLGVIEISENIYVQEKGIMIELKKNFNNIKTLKKIINDSAGDLKKRAISKIEIIKGSDISQDPEVAKNKYLYFLDVYPELPKDSEIQEMKERATIATKHFLMDHPKMRGIYKRILVLDNSLLIELHKDPIADELFKTIISESTERLEKLGVNFIDTCTNKSCLQLKVPDINLVPIARKGNALKFNGVIFADKVPESFKLKGFLEFEVKLDLYGI
jgi:hypothetical protein